MLKKNKSASSRHSFFESNQPKNRKRGNKKKIVNLIITIIILMIAFGGVGSLALLAWVAKDLPNPNKIIDRNVAESTKIFDRTGEQLLYDIHGQEQRTVVKLEDIPEYVKDATLTAEDRNFYQHSGFSITGIIRSFIKNITTGSKVGGSTLTQQLVKNAILSSEKSYTRKLKELILSYQIEKKFTKDQILQMYFNEIPYGSVAYGVEAAAQTYFSKSVKNIDLAEAAILAALPQAPSYYSPYGNNTDALYARQNYILDSMAELGYISKDQAEAAKNKKIEFKKRTANILAPHFVMYVKEYLTNKYGELMIEQGGLKVITTLDLYKQQAAEDAIKQYADNNAKKYNANNAALVALDPKTGQILAMVGSKDYFADPTPENCRPGRTCDFDPQVNVAINSRQPGSSFKPIVYAASFVKGYTPETVLYDVKTNFQNYDLKNYQPNNYDLGERGPVTIKQALAGSLNIPAVKAIYLTGVDNVLDLADNLGYTTLKDRSRFGLSLVLGGGEVKLIEHVAAFSVFAQEGKHHNPVGILRVEDKDGNVLEEYKDQEQNVLDPQVARQIDSILTDNSARAYVFGENNHLTLGDRPVGAKTGTTNNFKDAWTMGFTPSLAAGVWVGNSDNTEMKRGADGSIVAAPIWQIFMQKALADAPIEQFTPPEPTTTDKPVLNGSLASGLKVKIDKASGKLATSLTPNSFVEEKTFQQAHSILYYINKDDPQGDTPPDRSTEQFNRWESAVQDWAQRNNIVNQDPPTEFDDLHTVANRPNINIINPSNGQTISDRNFNVNISTSAPRGVNRVEYYINNQLVGTSRSAPFSTNLSLQNPDIGSGNSTLKAIAYDDIDNSRSDEISINLNLPAPQPALIWLEPTDNSTVNSSDFPLTIRAQLTGTINVQKADLFYVNSNGNDTYVNTVQEFSNNILESQWLTPPTPGSYQFFAKLTAQTGDISETPKVTITIQ
ncbi:MAG: PBP1A family penicillin-binding protein [Candidatus Buchananbacteria bacterium]|nr:PBP1A family penicillin-binding protein [Candidatus Buchananbacteria bacterium]